MNTANNNSVTLQLFQGEEAKAAALIQGFWKEHNHYNQTPEEAVADLKCWTAEGHRFYFIRKDGQTVGFVHLGSRGAEIDWLEDLFVKPEFQGQGVGSAAVKLVEQEVCKYSESLYIEAAARNESAIRLYRRLGYDCLNTVTVRKDFHPDEFEAVRKENIYGAEFEIRRKK